LSGNECFKFPVFISFKKKHNSCHIILNYVCLVSVYNESDLNIKKFMERDINEIISKSISGKSLDAKEHQLLASWIKETGNERFYQKMESLHASTKEIAKLPHMNVEQAYGKHQKLLKEARSKRRTLFLNGMMRYAAAVLLVIAVSGVMFYVSRQPEMVQQEKQWMAGVVPGSQKAELILADGKVMNLEEKKEEEIKEQDGTQIRNTGKTLIYGAPQKSKLAAPSYNSLIVPRGGEYQLVLEDGTKVWVNSESRLRYPTQFQSSKRIVLLEGEAYFEVSKDKNRPFIVKTNGVDVRVLGTSFNVSSYSNEKKILTTLVEGRVEVIDSDRKDSKVVLEPGYQAIYSKEEAKLGTEKVNVALYTSWKDGRFVFEKTGLVDIMHRVSRWYDVKMFYQNSDVCNIRFTGSLKRYDSLERLLSMIEKTNEVRFVIEEKSIKVEKISSQN